MSDAGPMAHGAHPMGGPMWMPTAPPDLAPLLLGAPVTLVLRALPSRPGRRGRPRRWLVALLHSHIATAPISPLFTAPLFLVSLYGLYLTPLFTWAMRGLVGHTWMLLHFLVVGLLLFWPILAVDP